MKKDIVVIAEYFNGKICSITDELIASAVEMAGVTGSKVKVAHIKGIDSIESEKYKFCITPLLKEINPSFILMGHTSQGIDIASGLAVRLGYECITGVNKISKNSKNDLIFSRSVFKGKANALFRVKNSGNSCLFTIQPGSFSIKKSSLKYPAVLPNHEYYDYRSSSADSDVLKRALYKITKSRTDEITKDRTNKIDNINYISITKSENTKSKLTQAKTIVAAGRGIGEQENIKYIEKMADCFVNSAVAGSRPLIDTGWLPYEQQVGITGAAVSPELYIAIGISGSSQHIMGMKDSKFIVSINKDKNAAVFNLSDICIVEDGINFIKAFLEENVE